MAIPVHKVAQYQKIINLISIKKFIIGKIPKPGIGKISCIIYHLIFQSSNILVEK